MERTVYRPLCLLIAAALGLLGWADPAPASSFRLVDRDGVVHLTNAPTNARYQPQPGWSGTASGWLAIPEGARGRYAQEITDVADRHGVDPKLVHSVIRVESAFNPWAVSRKGARGLMQLMPRTASALGVRDSFNPAQNIDGGVRHLRALIDRYGGNLPLALAAYNAGAQAVDWYRGIPPYPETQQYIRRILNLYGPGAGPPQVIYRYEDSQGTIVYTNIPPVFPGR
ncbi:MAG: lytic transglycosylase domain-containing protein [Candidatus Rokubacteria bacterium]|nr:lytic transglycosylase domain-containing protein [Candidatus Rokubacteria bacterium]MBI2544079.1 lytic transglycosylase domain-containing protein [Candidatus Rokubacteria bacterium]MBI2553621.1 lytic transglycosylase domain-containing protein [Candidatus Rokubacteria bacterium]